MMKILSRNRKRNGNKGKQGDYAFALFIFIVLTIAIILTSCGSGGQSQSDPRLKWFHVLSSRIIIRDNQAEVDGTLQNTGSERYPFDVTIDATFYDKVGNVIGQAEGVAEDVFPGTTRAFVLIGQVDSLHYSHMQLTPVSLREQRIEKNLPTSPPVSPCKITFSDSFRASPVFSSKFGAFLLPLRREISWRSTLLKRRIVCEGPSGGLPHSLS